MRNFEITFLEYEKIEFGSGITRIENQTELDEEKAILSFLKRKTSTGQVVVFKSIKHVPIKEKM